MRPPVSVCMAAFNGERFITAQLQSILSQLAPGDEVIVVDDASTDRTCKCVASLRDNRIRLIEHEQNKGVSRTFEDAIRAASHSILFLSDQDDLWADAKVDTILKSFRENPDVTLIATDAAIIDADGKILAPSYFSPKGDFHPGFWANLQRNRFCGCTMALRAEILSTVLPLPHEDGVLHDVWIGVRNSLSGHRTLYIDEALVLYRRHATNVTGRERLSVLAKIRNRLHLLRAVLRFSLREGMRMAKDIPREKDM